MTNPFYNPEFEDLVDKKLVVEARFGPHRAIEMVRGDTYTTRHDELAPTPFFTDFHPFSDDMRAAKNVLEIGGGIGRNLPIIMEQTNAHYWNVDPAEDVPKYFWDIQDKKYQDRVTLCRDFTVLPPDLVIDFVIVTFVFMHIGFRPLFGQMDVSDMTKAAMKHTHNGTVWYVLEHEREEVWQERWLSECGIKPDIYYKPGGMHFGGGTMPYPEFEPMTHRGNDHNLIIFKETK